MKKNLTITIDENGSISAEPVGMTHPEIIGACEAVKAMYRLEVLQSTQK